MSAQLNGSIPTGSSLAPARSLVPAKRTEPGLGITLALELSSEQVDAIAARVAGVLTERQAPAEPEGYLDVAGAARFLCCPTSRIYALVSAKRIPHERDGSRLLFDRGELREYVRSGGARRP